MFLKPRNIGLTTASLTTLVFQMRYEGKQKTTLRLIMFKDDAKTLRQYLYILDNLNTTTTYKAMKSNEGKFQGYLFTIKLKAL